MLQQAGDADGQSLTVLKVPMPRPIERRVFLSAMPDQGRSRHWSAEHFPPAEGRRQGKALTEVAVASYLNFVPAGGVVVLPDYLPHGTPRALQERVQRVFEQAFPGRQIRFRGRHHRQLGGRRPALRHAAPGLIQVKPFPAARRAGLDFTGRCRTCSGKRGSPTMRFDKLTTAFQQALADAQSDAVGRSNPYIEPAHLLAAMLAQPDGPRSLIERAGASVQGLATAMETAVRNLPQVQGGGQPVQPGRDLVTLLQAADKEAKARGDNFIASEMFLLAAAESKGDFGGIVRGHGLTKKALDAAIEAVRGGAKVDSAEAEGQREALKKYTLDLTERARAASSTR